MAEPRNLKHPPIVEAVIDWRCTTGTPVTPELVKLLAVKIGYPGDPLPVDQAQLNFQVKAGAAPVQAMTQKRIGARYASADGKYVAMLRSDGFTFSRLNPYTKWDEVFPEAWRLWQIYCAEMKVSQITRIAVRNINRLLLPYPDFSNNPEAFLSPAPAQPAPVGGKIANWLSRFAMEEIGNGLSVTVTQMSDVGVAAPVHYAMILDIDASTVTDLSLNSEHLTARFLELRQLKNAIFFGAVTDRTLDLFS